MAFYLKKENTASTPYVLIDEAENYMKLEGRSFHENAIGFYKEIADWLDGYLRGDFGSFTFDCAMEYFNSSTAKILYNLLMKLDKCAAAEKITVNWITTEANEIIIECGEDFAEEVKHIAFNLVIED